LDIVQIEGASQVKEAGDVIKQLYESFGWQVLTQELAKDKKSHLTGLVIHSR